MEEQTKPYSLQAPEAIAKEYGGNKQAIIRAVQAGIVDPTAATLAGMFIDRMRSAASLEQQANQTVSDKVFAPPQVAQAGLPAAPGAQMAPQVAPPVPQQGMPAGAPPMPQQPMTAAEGGLMSLSVDESMFPDEEEYAGGGIVAFAAGTPDDFDYNAAANDISLAGGDPENIYGVTPGGLARYVQEYRSLIPPESDDIKALREFYKGAPERLEKQKTQDMWTAITMGGLAAAAEGKPTTGNVFRDLLGAASIAGKNAMPHITEGLKSKRSGEEAAMKARADLSKMDRAEQLEAIKGALGLYGKDIDRQAQIDAAKITAGKGTELDRAAAVFLKGLGSKGYDVNDPQVQAAAYEMAFNAKGLTEYKGELSTAQGMQAKWELANKETNRILDNTKSGPGLEYFLATQRDAAAKKAGKPTNESGEIRKRVMDEQLRSLPDPTKPQGGMFKLPELKKSGVQDKADQKVAESKKPEPKKGPPGLRKPDLSKIQGLPSGSTLGTYVAGRGWQVIQGGNIIGHIQAD